MNDAQAVLIIWFISSALIISGWTVFLLLKGGGSGLTMDETSLQRKIQEWVSHSGGNSLKLHGNAFQRKGEPDLIGSLPGPIPFAVETKVGDNTPSKIQLYRLSRWAEQGWITGVVYSLDEFIALFEPDYDYRYCPFCGTILTEEGDATYWCQNCDRSLLDDEPDYVTSLINELIRRKE